MRNLRGSITRYVNISVEDPISNSTIKSIDASIAVSVEYSIARSVVWFVRDSVESFVQLESTKIK